MTESTDDVASPRLSIATVDKRPVRAGGNEPAEEATPAAVPSAAVPTSAALGLGAAAGIGLGVVGSSIGLPAESVTGGTTTTGPHIPVHDYRVTGGDDAPGGGESYGAGGSGQDPYGTNPYGDDPYGSDPYGTNPYGTDPGGTNPYGTDPGGTDPYGTDPGGDPTGGYSSGPGTGGLLDYDAFAAQSGYGQKYLLQDMSESPVEASGLDTNTQPDATGEDSGDTQPDAADSGPTDDAPQDTGDDVVDQANAHGEAVDAEILGHEGQVNDAKAIAEQAKSDRDGDSSSDGGGDSSAAGSGRNVLRIDGATLETLQTTARTVATNFDGDGIKAAKNKDREAVGHYSSLSGAIKSFYDNWSARREGIVKSVKTYADWMDQISEGFDHSDRDLAASLADQGAFDQDLYSQLREQQSTSDSAGGDETAPDTGRRGDTQGLVNTEHSTLQGHYQPPARSTTDVLRSIERIDGRAAYANYVAEYLSASTGFATATGFIGAGLGADAVAAEGIAALTDLITYAQQTGQLPEELGFLSFAGATGSDGQDQEPVDTEAVPGDAEQPEPEPEEATR